MSCTALSDWFIRKQKQLPGCQWEPGGVSSGPLPTCSREMTSNYRALSCRRTSHCCCEEAQWGGHCCQLLAFLSARGDSLLRPPISVIISHPVSLKITWVGLNNSCILANIVQLQAESTAWLPLLHFFFFFQDARNCISLPRSLFCWHLHTVVLLSTFIITL